MVISEETDGTPGHPRCPDDLAKIVLLLEPHRTERQGVVLGSTYNWYWLVDGLKNARFEVKLPNTAAMKGYDGLKPSDEQDDAAFLANLLSLGILPTGYVNPPQERTLRDRVSKRIQLVRSRSQHVLPLKSRASCFDS